MRLSMERTFWALVAIDGLALVFLILTALTSERSVAVGRSLSTATLIVLPGLLLGGAILLFTATRSLVARAAALVLAWMPWLLIVAGKGSLLAEEWPSI